MPEQHEGKGNLDEKKVAFRLYQSDPMKLNNGDLWPQIECKLHAATT